jgi:hypothetical protein
MYITDDALRNSPAKIQQQKIDSLERENKFLRRENLELKEEIKILNEHNNKDDAFDNFVMSFPLDFTDHQKRIIALLYLTKKQHYVTRDAIKTCLGLDLDSNTKNIDVHLYNVKQRAIRHDYNIKIETIWGRGCRLTDESRLWIDALMEKTHER